MLRKIYLLVTIFISTFSATKLLAQSIPDGVIFQAVATDPQGKPASGRTVYIKDAILQTTATGTVVYSETFKVTASSTGVFTIVIGKGQRTSGPSSISSLDWSAGPYFLNLKAAVAPSVPSKNWNVDKEYIDMGTSQFWSVPFALYANKVAGFDLKLNITDTTNMLKPYLKKSDTASLSVRIDATKTVVAQEAARALAVEALKENKDNKSISMVADSSSDIKYPSVKSVKTYVDGQVDSALSKAAIKMTSISDSSNSNGGTIVSGVLSLTPADGKNGGIVTTGIQTIAGAKTFTFAPVLVGTNVTGTASGLSIGGNAATVTTNANLTGVVTSTGNATSIASGAISNAMLSNGAVANLSGTNTGDNAVNSLYNGLVSNATHTGDVTGSTALTIANNAVTTSKILDANVTDAKISSVSASKISGILPVANGGTGSGTQNFVDLTTNQTLAGVKSFSAAPVLSTATASQALFTDASKNVVSNAITGTGDVVMSTSPSLAGIPTAPTASIGTSTTQIATTEFVYLLGNNLVPYSGAIGAVDLGAYDLKVSNLTIGLGGGAQISNTALGINSLYNNSTGVGNSAIGRGSLYSNTTGIKNTASGFQSLYANTTGSFNTASGNQSLFANTTGNGNASFGQLSLLNNETGSENTSIGTRSMFYNRYGNYNTAVGWNASTFTGDGGSSSTSGGNNNTSLGYRALYSNSLGNDNTAVGYNALQSSGFGIATASQNTAIGSGADVASNNLNNSTALGFGAIVAKSNAIQLGNASVTNVKTSGTVTAGAVTYPNTDGVANQVLSTNGLGNVSWVSQSGSGVPYTGATSAVNLGAYDLKVNELTVGQGGGGVASNTANGNSALVSNTTGANNTANGYYALASNTTGVNNTANGNRALVSNTTGMFNTATGNYALSSNTTGAFNIANGGNALLSNTTGTINTAIGYNALVSNTTGNGNTANGSTALYSNTTGGFNTAIGVDALNSNTTGANNTANGVDALEKNTTGSENTANGISALVSNTTGTQNTANGSYALLGNATGTNNTAIGYYANVAIDGLTNATAIGSYAIVTASNHIQLGNRSIDSVITSGKLKLGSITLPNTDGAANQVLSTNGSGSVSWVTPSSSGVPYTGATSAVDLGAFDLKVNQLTVGKGGGVVASNTAIGYDALVSNTTGAINTAIGQGALGSNTTGPFNTAMGGNALNSNTEGTANTAIGVDALRSNTTGTFNTANGSAALQLNTTGFGNTAVGRAALFYNTTGSENTANGIGALSKNTEGFANTAIGQGALSNNTTGSGNTTNGAGAGDQLISGNNNLILGYIAQASSNTVSNEITLGNSSISTLRAMVTSITALSDRRDKTNIIPIGEGLAFLKKLNPVSFTWDTRDKSKVDIKSAGFIAQELLALQKQSNIGDNLDLVSENNPEKLEARYGNLLPVIVKAIQEESAEKDKEIKELKDRINTLEKLMNQILNNKK